ncbi:hypothetical protein CLAVI_000795 [Candidatus Clavichlamydia salmonicola]|uniref:hypothetical protein n=1 Tax=Candidatus Clavichlamydia salmonicola TaxID=469812 RepID=UPI00189114FB|nr:hypothetical protein [Candidatus Clavichlamydia salmonicola]MBF5051159.1 hypothetical protein [Candidatus Clavichlamydia salmonicola]
MSDCYLDPYKNSSSEIKPVEKNIFFQTFGECLTTTFAMIALFFAGPIMAFGASLWTLGNMCLNGFKLLKTENQDFLRSIKLSAKQVVIWLVWLIPGIASLSYLKQQILKHSNSMVSVKENRLITVAKRGAALTASVTVSAILGPAWGLLASTWYLGKTGASIAKHFKIDHSKENSKKSKEKATKSFFESKKVNYNIHQLGKWFAWVIPGVAPISLLLKAINDRTLTKQ